MLGTLVISLDLELHWGVHDTRSLRSYETNLRNVRAAVRALLSLFSEFGIHATWASVGLLACSDQSDARTCAPRAKPTYTIGELSPYRLLKGGALPEAYYFAPQLLSTIAKHDGQEIGTHTFSHYYCLEKGQIPEQFREDLRASLDVLSRFGRRPQSIVFPRNQYSRPYLDVCAEEGIRFFRGNPASTFYDPHEQSAQTRPRRLGRLLDSHLPLVPFTTLASRLAHRSGLIDVSASRFFRPTSRRDPTAFLRVTRIEKEMEAAALQGRAYHLWWHPHNTAGDIEANIRTLRRIFKTFDRLRRHYGMRTMNMAECGSEHVREI